MSSIPASELVRVIPGVLAPGGTGLALNSVILTQNSSVPIDAVLAFPNVDSVKDYFGATSDEAEAATVYFNGFEGATTLPTVVYFARWTETAAAAYLRSASFASVTLVELQEISGVLTIVINGRTLTSAAIDLSSATSFSNAAALIQAALRVTGGLFTGVASLGDTAGPSTELSVESVVSGSLQAGDIIVLDGSFTTEVVEQVSGTPGGVGIYTVADADEFAGVSATVTSPVSVTYGSQLNAFVIQDATVTGDESTITYASGSASALLLLTEATGATLSQGSDASVAATVLDTVVDATQNWALFMTVWEPDTNGKLAFADWVNDSGDRYGYVGWDSDTGPTLSDDDSGSFGRLTMNYDGVVRVWGPMEKAAFICGTAASIDFLATNGRITFAYKRQSGLQADVTSSLVAQNLLSNGYVFYGDYATANNQFQFLQNGQISGEWLWIDEYVNQIKLNSDLQLAFMTMLAQVKAIPYNARGYNLMRAAAADPINAHLNFGTIQPGVELSALQIAQIDTAAGVAGVGRAVSQTGYYLQIKSAPPSVRAERGSPPASLWYASGGSIQKIELDSINVL